VVRTQDQHPGPLTFPNEQFADVIERLDHVSMAVNNLAAMEDLVSLLSGRPFDRGFSSEGDFDWIQYDIPGDSRLELIATSSKDPEHFITRFISERGEGLHHLTFKVTSIESARMRADELGFRVVGYSIADPTWSELFLHPASTHGVLIQFAEFEDTKRT
jgi:methylmalonyl-CoA/ethylmalonyl-CoA epimerase